MNAIVKRVFDIVVSLFAVIVFLPFIGISWFILMFDTQSNGFFFQKRVENFYEPNFAPKNTFRDLFRKLGLS